MFGAQNLNYGGMAAGLPQTGGNRSIGASTGGQSFSAFNAASAPLGRGFGAPGAVSHGTLPTAFGPADPSNCNVLFDGWQGLGRNPAPVPASPGGYGAAYTPSGQCKPQALGISIHAFCYTGPVGASVDTRRHIA